MSTARWRVSALFALLWAALAAAPPAPAADSAADAARFFESRVRPILIERCQECHDRANAESQLNVTSRAALLRGGTRGPALIPGDPDASLLVRALQHDDSLQMPPKQKLPAREIADIITWIKQGASWPGAPDDSSEMSAEPTGNRPARSWEEQASHWSFQTPQRPELPFESQAEVASRGQPWIGSPVDAPLLAHLRSAGLAPAMPAARRQLIRRVMLDLLGLPPTPDEMNIAIADDSPDAWERLVDRLLASPHYGERWGRHWLDVARYGDSNGLDENLSFANAFRYRDYVVAAVNRDLPYDEFIRQQVAGDLLSAPERDGERATDGIVATGFLVLGAKMLAEDDPVKMQMDIIDEQIDTLGRTVLGLTLGCARCHDHKFDPVTTADYYGLAGIFKSTKTMENFQVVARWQERILAEPEIVASVERLRAAIAEKQAGIDAVKNAEDARLVAEVCRQGGDYLLAAREQERLETAVEKTPILGGDPAHRPPGTVILEAEDFARGNVRKDRDGYGAGIGVLVNLGEAPNFVEHEIELPADGLYQLELRYAAAESRPCRLQINQVTVKTNAAARVTGGWQPESQAWYVEGFYRLRAGKNLLRLEQPAAFPHIDKILLAPAPPNAASDVTPPLAAGFTAKTVFVQRWAEYLKRSRGKPDSLLAPWWMLEEEKWRELLARLGSANSPPDAALVAIVGSGPAPTPRELAARYQSLLSRAADAWLAVPVAVRGEPLADPVLEPFRRLLADPQGPLSPTPETEQYFPEPARAELTRWREEKAALERQQPKLPEAMAVSEGKPESVRIHIRGSHLTLGPETPRQFPRVLTTGDAGALPADGSGRRELARWLTRPEHPLTARVIVNRVWQWHFGEGLVRSPDNFGLLGERPTHPELLDWLATELPRRDWSLKALHRVILSSSAYRMSTVNRDETAAARDPENRLWWRFPRRRLDAETIRDSLLAVSDRLDRTMTGSLLPTPNRQYVTSTANVNPQIYETTRRSIYLPVVRSALYDVFQVFDFPDPTVQTGQRQSTTIAPQALFMMNSKFVSQAAEALARQWTLAGAEDDPSRVRSAYGRVCGRDPDERECSAAIEYLRAYEQALTLREADSGKRRELAWRSFARALLESNQFLYLE